MISSSQKESLLLLARAAQQNAYAPYSNFRVGAAVLLEKGSPIAPSALPFLPRFPSWAELT